MTGTLRTVLKRVLGLSLVVVGTTALQCPSKRPAAVPAVEAPVIPDSADQVVLGSEVVLTTEGIRKGVLLSDTAYTYEDGTRLELRQFNVTFYTSTGEKEGVLRAREGTYNRRLSRLEARGSVIVLAEDGRRLDTEQLVYDQARNQIFSDSAFVLNQPPRQISGIGFESDPKLSVFRVFRGAKAVAPLKIPGE